MSITSVMLAACGTGGTTTTKPATNAATTISETTAPESTEPEALNDVDFIVNLGKGLEARWKESNVFDNETDEEKQKLTLSEYKDKCRGFVDAELDSIGNIDDYVFENESLAKSAQEYYDCLELQKNAIDSFVDSTLFNNDWNYGTDKRCILIEEFYSKYGLTVSDNYKDTLQSMVDTDYYSAKQSVALHDFVNELGDTINFQEDTEKSSSSYKYYKALITNDTEYEIGTLDIDIDLLDEAGVVIEQPSVWLTSLQPGGKYYAEFSTDKQFSGKNIRITANW